MKAWALAGIAAALSAAGCVRNSFTEADFLSAEGISLYIKGEMILEYIPERCQIGFSPEAREIRISDDNMADYFILDFHGDIPLNEGEEAEADLTYTTADNLKREKGIRLQVTRKDDERGLVWLRDKACRTGIVIPDMTRLEQ